jgi:hypothetical protein
MRSQADRFQQIVSRFVTNGAEKSEQVVYKKERTKKNGDGDQRSKVEDELESVR